MTGDSIVDGGSPASNSAITSSTLLMRLRMQDQTAWEKLVTLYGPLIYRWCREQRVQAAETADIVAEVFRTVFQNIEKFRHDKPGSSFRGWLWTVTRSRICDYYRARAAHAQAIGGTDAMRRWQEVPEEEPESEMPSDPRAVADSPARRAMELVRGEFRPRTWQAFWRATVERQKVADIAEDLGISANAVRKAKSRVLHRIREEFHELLS